MRCATLGLVMPINAKFGISHNLSTFQSQLYQKLAEVLPHQAFYGAWCGKNISVIFLFLNKNSHLFDNNCSILTPSMTSHS